MEQYWPDWWSARLNCPSSIVYRLLAGSCSLTNCAAGRLCSCTLYDKYWLTGCIWSRLTGWLRGEVPQLAGLSLKQADWLHGEVPRQAGLSLKQADWLAPRRGATASRMLIFPTLFERIKLVQICKLHAVWNHLQLLNRYAYIRANSLIVRSVYGNYTWACLNDHYITFGFKEQYLRI